MKRIFALLMLVCLGSFVVACGSGSSDSSTGGGGRADSAEDAGGTSDNASADTDKGTTSGAASESTDGATVDGATDESGTAASDATKKEPLEAPDENINLSLDPPANE